MHIMLTLLITSTCSLHAQGLQALQVDAHSVWAEVTDANCRERPVSETLRIIPI